MEEINFPSNLESIPNAADSRNQVRGPESGSFEGLLKQSLQSVNELQQKADQAIDAFATGQQTDIHNTMIAMEKADIAFKLILQIRNKVISAYETIMRTQV
jgi:flagellar hook-basal body complex protein FliE